MGDHVSVTKADLKIFELRILNSILIMLSIQTVILIFFPVCGW